MSLNILCISFGTSGNLSPLLTAARQLRAAGHRIRVMADPAMRAEVETSGFSFISWRRAPTGPDADPMDASDVRSWFRQAVFDPARAYADDTFDEIRRVPTHAVIVLDFLFGAALGAEAAGIPFAILSPHVSMRPLPGVPPATSGLEPPKTEAEKVAAATFVDHITGTLDHFLPSFNAVREQFGLGALQTCFDMFDRAARVLLAISEAFDFKAETYPLNYRLVGPLLDEPRWSGEWTPPWTSSAVPRILVAGSTGAQNQVDLLRRVIRAIGTLDVEAVITSGPNVRVRDLPAPDNVHVITGAPHGAAMGDVSLVVSQGGHGTVARALMNGLPLLVLPMGRDQGDNAVRVASRGAGLRLEPDASEADIADAMRRLLSEPHFREAAINIGTAIRKDVDEARVPREVESMCAEFRPVVSAVRRRLASGAA